MTEELYRVLLPLLAIAKIKVHFMYTVVVDYYKRIHFRWPW